MEYLIIGIVSFFASGLTLFSGFGLGTILMPVFALFFPLDISIALTAIVHLFNNFFKLILLGKKAERSIVLKFGIPAVLAAFFGSQILFWLDDLRPLYSYYFHGKEFFVLPIKLIIAVLMIIFVILESLPVFKKMTFDKKYLPVGGLLSGLFGGLSGHQGALRSMFLIKCGLEKEVFIATGVVIACLVDLTRITSYSAHFIKTGINDYISILVWAIFCAFLGVFVGNKLVKKVTLNIVQMIVSIVLFVIAALLAAGLV